jgi:hypothetical protein
MRALRFDINDFDNDQEMHCLLNGGLMGLPNFANPTFDVVGNLFERGYDHDSVKEALEYLATKAPSLKAKVHLGGDYETADTTHTITLENGVATVGPPEEPTLPEISDEQMAANMVTMMSGR